MQVVFVLPDYQAGRPRACMDGWARCTLLVAPDGIALPCHAARALPGFQWPSVLEESLATIWSWSPGFAAFRGEDWMREPCRSCARRSEDFGGCRCQAFALTGDPANTDPACELSPHHTVVDRARSSAGLVRPERLVHR